jgi:FMN phosphatase YigB (HAD superfamily)
MRISFDLDGTIYAYPEMFRRLYQAFRAAGHEVGILTGHNFSEQTLDLARLHSYGFGPWDFLGYTNTEGDVPATVAAKAQYLIDQVITLHFDDVALPLIQLLRSRGYRQIIVLQSIP